MIPDEQLPMTCTVYRNTASIPDDSDWIGPNINPVHYNVKCLISWGNALFEDLPMGFYSDDSALGFFKPDEDIQFRDELSVTIGGREYRFVVENQPRVFLNPITWEMWYLGCSLKEKQ